MSMSKGFIYILTNPSFPQYVKIGYATDVKQRLDELNRSTAVPFAFRVYATYEVNSALSDKKLHSILDKLNPELRSMEEVDGKRRIREFYAMTPEDAYSILGAIAEINGFSHRLKKWKATAMSKPTKRWRRKSVSSIRNVWHHLLFPYAIFPLVNRLNFVAPIARMMAHYALLQMTSTLNTKINAGR